MFSVVWKIENHRLGSEARHSYISSPEFFVQRFLNTKWDLNLHPKGIAGTKEGNMACYLFRNKSGPNTIKVSYKIFLITSSSILPKLDEMKSYDFDILDSSAEKNIIDNTIFKDRSQLPDTIYIVCYMHMSEEDFENCSLSDSSNVNLLTSCYFKPDDMTSKCAKDVVSFIGPNAVQPLNQEKCFPNKCLMRTLFPAERRYFTCPLEDVFEGTSGKWSTLLMTVSDLPHIFVTVSFNKCLRIKVQVTKKYCDVYAVCKISISGLSVENYYSCESQHNFKNEIWNIKLLNVDEMEDLEKLHEEQLSYSELNCEFIISNGKKVSYVEEVSDMNRGVEIEYKVEKVHYRTSHQSKMKDMYENKQFCDVVIQVGDEKIEAHKAVLSMSSVKFKSIFENCGNSNERTLITIDNLEKRSVHQMLEFMYSGIFEDIPFEEAIKLYSAAAEFKVLPLQENCSRALRAKLNAHNACSVFRLAIEYKDRYLRYDSLHLIVRISNEVLITKEWKAFRDENPQCTIEILEKICTELKEKQMK